jgi:hypothetical protein
MWLMEKKPMKNYLTNTCQPITISTGEIQGDRPGGTGRGPPFSPQIREVPNV